MSGDFGARQSGGARGWLNRVRSPPWRLMIVLEQRANEQRSDNTYSMLYKGFRMPPLPLPTSDFSPCPKRPCGVQHTRASFGQASSLYPMSSSSNPHFPQVPKARAVFECLSGCQAMGLSGPQEWIFSKLLIGTWHLSKTSVLTPQRLLFRFYASDCGRAQRFASCLLPAFCTGSTSMSRHSTPSQTGF